MRSAYTCREDAASVRAAANTSFDRPITEQVLEKKGGKRERNEDGKSREICANCISPVVAVDGNPYFNSAASPFQTYDQIFENAGRNLAERDKSCQGTKCGAFLSLSLAMEDGSGVRYR